MATLSTCYAECLLPTRHRAHHHRNSQPALWPACLSTDVIPPLLLMLRHIHKGGVLNEPPPLPTLHSIISDVFLSANPTLPLFLPPPPSTTWVGGEKKKKSKQQQTSRVVFLVSGGGVVVGGWCCCLHASSPERVDDASQPASPPSRCVPVHSVPDSLWWICPCLFVVPFIVTKLGAWSCVWREHLTEWPLNSF